MFPDRHLADTAFNFATANLPREIADQGFQIARQFSGINQDSAALTSELVQQGALDIQLWQQAAALNASGTPSLTKRAKQIENAVSSTITTMNAVMNNLENGSLVPSQMEAANDWAIVAVMLNAAHAQIQGRQSAAAGYIAIAKQLAASFDKANGTYNVPAFESYLGPLNNQYQRFAAGVAQQYGLVGW